jgi:type IV pilus assembly protein PilQ
MNPHLKRGYGRGRLHLVVLTLAAILLGCASKTPPQQLEATTATASAPPVVGGKMITGIKAQEDAGRVLVTIDGNGKLAYFAVKQPDPLAVVLYFRDTVLSADAPSHLPGIDFLSGIKATELTDRGQASRIEMLLKTDHNYSVDQKDGTLTVSFSKPAPAPMKTEPEAVPVQTPPVTQEAPAVSAGPAASELEAVSAAVAGQSTLVTVQADGEIKNFKSFTLKNPSRIVFELLDLGCKQKGEQVIPVDSPWIQKIRYYAYPDKVRLVMDTNADNLKRVGAWPVASGLMIRVGQDSGQMPKQVAAAQAAPAAPPGKGESASVAPVIKPAKPAPEPAYVNRIDFASEAAGRSTILIGTTRPVQYAITKEGAHRLLLTLKDTILPKYRERPLITTRFQSAVDRILPAQKAGTPESAGFTIDLRDKVPYFVEQQDRLLLVHFDATSVPPRPLADETAPAWESAMQETGKKGEAAEVTPAPQKPAEPAEEATAEDAGIFPKNHYTGEKIALDFYETDIKNVFRILKEVSGKNFAIDKDVTGTVTLSFEKPVPWDQVLDLILKMNQLGKVVDGDIIRIATIATLKREEEDRQAALAAQKKAEEQQAALEPLETQYIKINYANAQKDILPQLQKISTDGRGSVTVDERSNQIIMTDTASKIAQAKALVKQLDNVTPQVIIEARIVEVTDSFSNDLGISWTGSQTNVQKDFLGGNIDWNVAMNFPAASSSGIGINFERIAGTPLLLDAKLTAIQSKGEAKIISAPKIVTLDNKKAKIKQGVEVGYLERDDAGGSSVKFKNVDLLLEVTPHVTPDQRVSMNIHITKNDVGDIINGVPSLNSNEAETELLVNNGDTIVIGGILKRTKETGTTEFPGLSSIPVLSWLFKEKSNSEKTGELLIFITPQIVQLAQR